MNYIFVLVLTWPDLPWLDLTWPDLSWLDLTWPDLTWLDLTWPELSSSYLRSKWESTNLVSNERMFNEEYFKYICRTTSHQGQLEKNFPLDKLYLFLKYAILIYTFIFVFFRWEQVNWNFPPKLLFFFLKIFFSCN